MRTLLSEAAWDGVADWLLAVLRESPNQSPEVPRFGTRVRCQWDDGCFYARFDCESPDIWASKTVRDDQIWDDPVVEIFLDPAGSGRCFFEFQVNPLGTIYDSYVADATQSADWQKWCAWNSENLRVAVHVDGKLNDRSHRDRGWSAVFAIAWRDLESQGHPRPRTGDIWRANFCRYERARDLSQPELSCWAPTVKVFDDLPQFGTIRFL